MNFNKLQSRKCNDMILLYFYYRQLDANNSPISLLLIYILLQFTVFASNCGLFLDFSFLYIEKLICNLVDKEGDTVKFFVYFDRKVCVPFLYTRSQYIFKMYKPITVFWMDRQQKTDNKGKSLIKKFGKQ